MRQGLPSPPRPLRPISSEQWGAHAPTRASFSAPLNESDSARRRFRRGRRNRHARRVCSPSLNVRPMAIASPTLFICVVSVGSACGNFSKAKRVPQWRDWRRRNQCSTRELRGGFARDVVLEFVEQSMGGVFNAPVLRRKPSSFGHLNAKSLDGVGGQVRFHEQSIFQLPR